ncbi:hypothetical protein ACQPW3_21515 [Actinosynnema sp. CA-248983]
MSTTTETGFQGGDVPEDATTTEVAPETPEQKQDQHVHQHKNGDRTSGTQCSGNGCVQNPPSN